MTGASAFLLALFFTLAAPSATFAQAQGSFDGFHPRHHAQGDRHRAMRHEAERSRDPLGLIQRQGVSSRHGGMGNMGGGSGRSANTGVGLGPHGNSQGPRF